MLFKASWVAIVLFIFVLLAISYHLNYLCHTAEQGPAIKRKPGISLDKLISDGKYRLLRNQSIVNGKIRHCCKVSCIIPL